MPLPNGPYYLLNDMESKVVDNLQNSNGESLSTMVGIALCRCGACNNKPFCDGTHSIIGFSSNNLGDGGKDKRRRNYIGTNITIHDNGPICSNTEHCVWLWTM